MHTEELSWMDFKMNVANRGLLMQHFIKDDRYTVLAFDNQLKFICYIDKEIPGEESSEQLDFENNFMASCNTRLEKRDNEGKQLMAIEKPAGKDFKAIVSHDFTKKCSWFGDSVSVVGETLSGSGVGPYSAVNSIWIDLTKGYVPREDEIAADYAYKIYDNGVEVTSGITVDCAVGTVVFENAPTGPVTADYHYANGSTWSLVPDAGKVIKLEHAELDFTTDINFEEVYFEIWAYNPMDLPNKVMVERVTYKGFMDIFKIANEVQTVQAVGEITQPTLRAVFDYASTIDLKSSFGTELRISTKNDAVMSGGFGSITLYTIIEDE